MSIRTVRTALLAVLLAAPFAVLLAQALVAKGAVNPPTESLPPNSDDHREFMHGMSLVKLGGKHMVVFSSNNYPPTQPPGEWTDDIYYSYIDPTNPNGTFSPKALVSRPTAQEPASAAVNSEDKLLVTAEDAEYSSNFDQTFGIWDSALNPTTTYGSKLMPPQGGHSGHVAGSGDKFLVAFSDGWIDGGGVDNNGTGDDVFARIVNSNGTTGSLINTAVGDDRDWWPVVAGSGTNWLQVWQRYGTAGDGGGTVMGAIIGQNGSVAKRFQIFDNDLYYYHDVQYVPALGLYLVTGSQDVSTNPGIAVLIDTQGNIVATKTGLPATVREARTVVSGTTAVYPALGTGAAVLNLSANSISLRQKVAIDWNWDYMGTDGVFLDSTHVLFATNTWRGVRFITAEFGSSGPPVPPPPAPSPPPSSTPTPEPTATPPARGHRRRGHHRHRRHR